MNRKTLKALKASIAKWENNAEAEKAHQVLLGVRDCPLCALFWTVDGETSCRGCPVFSTAARLRCQDTPYEAAEEAYSEWDDGGGITGRAKFQAAAQHEVDFLKSLLPTAAKAITAPTEEKAL